MKMLFEKLTEQDKNRIYHYIDWFGTNDGSERYRGLASLENLLSEWDKAKSETLFRLLGEEFIVEKEVEYKEPVSLLTRKISDGMNWGTPMNKFVRAFRSWAGTLSLDGWSNEMHVLNALVDSGCLAYEQLGQYNYIANYLPITIDFGDGQKIKLESNTKPMRAIGKLVKMFNIEEELFEQFRLEHSRILNTKNITGKLCLSIHPLDYMTMSMNAEKWTSCMNWGEPGGYRGGTVEMMTSPMVVVCYLKSDTNSFKWEDQEWNSKKWRLLLAVTPTGIISIKAYPYSHDEMTQTAIEWLSQLAKNNLNWSFGSVVTVPDGTTFHYPDNNQWYWIDFIEGDAMYCDWGCDQHFGCFNLNPDINDTEECDPDKLMLDYCGKRVCMCCGRTLYDFYDESYVYCTNCCSNAEEEEDGHYCSDCGEWCYDDDLIWVDDEPYCSCCIDEHAGQCAIDGVYYDFACITPVYLAVEADNPVRGDNRYCYIHNDYCSENYSLPENYVNNLKHPRKTWDGIWYFNREDLTERGLSYMYNMWNERDIEEYFSSLNS